MSKPELVAVSLVFCNDAKYEEDDALDRLLDFDFDDPEGLSILKRFSYLAGGDYHKDSEHYREGWAEGYLAGRAKR